MAIVVVKFISFFEKNKIISMMCLWTTLSTRDPLQGSTRLQCKCGMLVGRTIEHLVESDLVKKKKCSPVEAGPH